MEHEKTALDFYLRHYKPIYHDAFRSLYQQKEYHELLAPHFIPLTEELQQWATESFEGNSAYPEQLQYKTSSGILVRSKSEAIIELLLHMYKLPYRYECPLIFGNVTLYPDFTIRHPGTGDFYYWEHFGIIDEPEYRKKDCPTKIHFSR